MCLLTPPPNNSQQAALELKATIALVPAGDRTSPAYLAVHPFGKLPAARTPDGTPLFESGAILLYLNDACGGASSTPSSRAAVASWVLWSNASLWPEVEKRRAVPPPMLAGLEGVLARQPFLLGAGFSVADVAVASYLHYATAFFGARFTGAVARYVAEATARPAFRATIGAE